MKKLILNICKVLITLVLFCNNLYGQKSKSIQKHSNWFFEILDDKSGLPDTLNLYKRITYNVKIEKGVLKSDWLNENESESVLFGHKNYGNFSFYNRKHILYWSIIDGVLTTIATEWKWKFERDCTLKLISKKKTSTYNIEYQGTFKIPVVINNEIIQLETEMITLVKANNTK